MPFLNFSFKAVFQFLIVFLFLIFQSTISQAQVRVKITVTDSFQHRGIDSFVLIDLDTDHQLFSDNNNRYLLDTNARKLYAIMVSGYSEITFTSMQVRSEMHFFAEPDVVRLQPVTISKNLNKEHVVINKKKTKTTSNLLLGKGFGLQYAIDLSRFQIAVFLNEIQLELSGCKKDSAPVHLAFDIFSLDTSNPYDIIGNTVSFHKNGLLFHESILATDSTRFLVAHTNNLRIGAPRHLFLIELRCTETIPVSLSQFNQFTSDCICANHCVCVVHNGRPSPYIPLVVQLMPAGAVRTSGMPPRLQFSLYH